METFSSREAPSPSPSPSAFARELELLESVPGNLWSGLCARGKELSHLENKELLTMAVGGLAIGAGLAFASKNPEALWGLAGGITRNATKIGLAGVGLDLGRRVALPMWDTYRNPMNLQDDKQYLAKNLGGLPLDYAIGMGTAWAGTAAPEAMLGLAKLGSGAAARIGESLAFEGLQPVTPEGFRFDVPKFDVQSAPGKAGLGAIKSEAVDDEGSVGQLLKDRLRDLRLDAALQGQPVAIAETAGPKDLEGDDLKHWMRESRLDAVLQQRPAIETGAPSETGSVVDHIDGADVKHWQRDLRLDAVLHGQPEIGGVPETVAPEGEGTDLKVALREQRLERLFRNPTVSHAGNEVEPVSEGIDVGANLRAQRVNAILGIRDSV